MNRKYTIKDIATIAGVSKGTVDRVLHNRGKVSPIALEKVNEVLKVIDYQPNLIARNLKNNKIYRICVVLPDPEFDPYWLPCVKGIEDAVKEYKGYNLSVKNFYFDPEKKKTFIKATQTVLELEPDAVLLAPLFRKEAIEAIEEFNASNIIVSTFNSQVESIFVKNFIGQDLFKSGRVAASLLNRITPKGQIAIVHIDETFKNAIHMQEKERGFRNYFEGNENSEYSITTLKLKNPNLEINFRNFLDDNPDLSGIFITTSKSYQIAKIISEIKNDRIGVVAYDLIPENINSLNQGIVDFIIHQNEKKQTYLGITSLVEHFLFQKEIPVINFLPIDIVNAENAIYYL